jgi:hypothetical protein
VNRIFRILIIFICFVFTAGSFYSCKTTRNIAVPKLKPLNTRTIIKNLNEKPTGFERLSIKKISCQISGTSTNATFRASLKLVKNDKILVSFSKLNIPVGRILLTPDSVIYVNYLDKQYFKGDYTFIAESMNINFDFWDIQAILFNNIFSYYNDPADINIDDFESFAESGLYVLQSVNNRKLTKLYEKLNSRKADRYLRRKNDDAFIVQSIYIDPDKFNIVKIRIEDSKNNRKAEFDFGEFSAIDGRDYPGAIDMTISTQEEKLAFNVRLNGFSTQEEDDFALKIPERYTPVVIKK